MDTTLKKKKKLQLRIWFGVIVHNTNGTNGRFIWKWYYSNQNNQVEKKNFLRSKQNKLTKLVVMFLKKKKKLSIMKDIVSLALFTIWH